MPFVVALNGQDADVGKGVQFARVLIQLSIHNSRIEELRSVAE